MKLILNAPISSLSLGQVSYNIIRECWKRNLDIAYHPIGDVQLDAFQPPKELVDYIQDALNKRGPHLSRDIKTLKIWHIQSQEPKDPFRILLTPEQTLLTFHETNSVTDYERTLVNLNTKTLFCGNYSENIFRAAGCPNVGSFNVGWDEDFKTTGKKYLEGRKHYLLAGKFERRKNTTQIIKSWVKKYGNNKDYALTCLINNPFFSAEDNQRLINEALDGRRIWNVNFLPHLKTNQEVNDLHNAIDIDLSGASFSESWGIPSFTSCGLGKVCVVNNFGGHKAWATAENSVLIEPDGMQDCYDGVFFNRGGNCSQGQYSHYNEDALVDAMERAEQKIGQPNTAGLMLQKTHSWKNSLDSILKEVYN